MKGDLFYMAYKTATFNKKDEELVKAIEDYQHRKQLASFIDAVRKLCSNALEIEKIQAKK
jgi:predicted component of type VI protein secretion system